MFSNLNAFSIKDPSLRESGLYDTSGWVVDNTNFDRDMEVALKKNSTKKKKFNKSQHSGA